MSIQFTLAPSLTLRCERCSDCNRWYGYEGDWRACCGSCQKDRNTKLQETVNKRDLTIAALRGALTKAQKMKGTGT